MESCSVEECVLATRAKGWCAKHYQRARRSGHPTRVTKDCRECGATFTYAASKGRRHFLCSDCVANHIRLRDARYSQRQSNAAEAEPEFYIRLKAYQFRSNIRRYGITPEQFDAMLMKQEGRCAICAATPDPDGKGAYARLHIDHCHETGLVRGLLCGRCNQGLGYFRDNPDNLASAIDYLKAKVPA